MLEVLCVSHWIKIKSLAGPHSLLEASVSDCWQGSVPCSCGNFIPVFFLAVGRGPSPPPRGCKHFLDYSLFLTSSQGERRWSQVSLSLHLLLLLPSRPLNFSQERFSTYKNPCDKTVPADIIQSHPFISRSVSLVTSAESPLPEGVAYSMYSSVSRIGAVNSYPLAPKDTPPEGLTWSQMTGRMDGPHGIQKTFMNIILFKTKLMSFSIWQVKVKSLSRVRLFATPWL